MSKQIVRISSEKLARIIHMELMDVGFFYADEAYEALAKAGRGSITIAVSDDVNVFEVEELEV